MRRPDVSARPAAIILPSQKSNSMPIAAHRSASRFTIADSFPKCNPSFFVEGENENRQATGGACRFLSCPQGIAAVQDRGPAQRAALLHPTSVCRKRPLGAGRMYFARACSIPQVFKICRCFFQTVEEPLGAGAAMQFAMVAARRRESGFLQRPCALGVRLAPSATGGARLRPPRRL